MIEFAAVMTGTRLTGFIITVILYNIDVKWVTIAMKKIRRFQRLCIANNKAAGI